MKTAKVLRFHPERCKGDRECERACSNVHFKTKDGGQKSAIRIVEVDGRYEMTVCNHCGLCMDMCQVLALKRLPSGTVALDKGACIGCQACVAFCPISAMRKAPGFIVPFKCISCGACVKACPEKALELVDVPLEELEREVYAKHGKVCK